MTWQKNLSLFWKVILWSLFMIVLFTLPGSAFKTVKTFSHIDLVVHAIFYFIQTSLLIQAIHKYNTLNKKSLKLFVFLLLPFIMGFTIEAIQELFIENRYWDHFDIMANIVGLLLAFGFAQTKIFYRLFPI